MVISKTLILSFTYKFFILIPSSVPPWCIRILPNHWFLFPPTFNLMFRDRGFELITHAIHKGRYSCMLLYGARRRNVVQKIPHFPCPNCHID